MATDTPLVDVPVPDGLSGEELAVWEELAPLAKEQRTLTPATARRFRLLCRQVVREDRMTQQIDREGLTYIAVTVDGSGQERETLKAHPLCGPQRGMMQRIETGLQAFRLAPTGRPIAPTKQEKPKSALAALQASRAGIRAVK